MIKLDILSCFSCFFAFFPDLESSALCSAAAAFLFSQTFCRSQGYCSDWDVVRENKKKIDFGKPLLALFHEHFCYIHCELLKDWTCEFAIAMSLYDFRRLISWKRAAQHRKHPSLHVHRARFPFVLDCNLIFCAQACRTSCWALNYAENCRSANRKLSLERIMY